MERSSGAAPPRQSGGSGQANGNPLTVRIEPAADGAAVIALVGELDLSTIPRVESRLFRMVSRGPVVLDLSRLSFIDSSGIGVLIQAFRSTDGSGRMHTVIATGTQVERVLRLAGIDRALPIFLDREAALEAFPGDGGPRD